MQRREFLSSALTLAAANLAPRAARAADSLVEILINEPIGEVAAELHGHFTEHIGGVVYDGIWVGEDSKIPNVGGIRKALVDHMRQLKAPVVRWPGGCFADSYNWHDGIGPRAERPVRTNFWANEPQLWNAPDGPQKYALALPNSCGSAAYAGQSRIWRPMSAASRPWTLTSGWSTATRRLAPRRSPPSGRPTEARSRSMLLTGASVMSHGLRRGLQTRRLCRRIPALHLLGS